MGAIGFIFLHSFAQFWSSIRRGGSIWGDRDFWHFTNVFRLVPNGPYLRLAYRQQTLLLLEFKGAHEELDMQYSIQVNGQSQLLSQPNHSIETPCCYSHIFSTAYHQVPTVSNPRSSLIMTMYIYNPKPPPLAIYHALAHLSHSSPRSLSPKESSPNRLPNTRKLATQQLQR